MQGIIVLTTCPDHETASRIAHKLIQKKLAACIQISSPITSVYPWKGEVCKDQEFQLWIKTQTSRWQALRDEISSLHPFEVPEILSIPIQEGLKDYMKWLTEETN